MGKKNRYHLKTTCWFKDKGSHENKIMNNIRSINNSDIET